LKEDENLNFTFVIWDFNGTLFDDVQIGMDSLNVLLERRGLPMVRDKDAYKAGFMFPIIEGYKRLGFDFNKESYDDVAEEWVIEYRSREDTAGLADGVREALEHFKILGMKQIIISASEISMLRCQLDKLGISSYFEEIVGVDNIHGSGKKDIALRWRKKHPSDKLLFIGDTDHDAEVAKVINADCILVAKGHQSFERLKKTAVNAEVLSSCAEIIYKLNK
jgi:phosphoglycolate phosphatase